MTNIVAMFMLLAPGLIAIRVLWHNKPIGKEDYKHVFTDYVIYSFLIQMSVYGFMFFTHPLRTVSFSVGARASSHILSASFVFKYSAVALVAAVALPAVLPRLIRLWRRLEDNRSKKKDKVE